MELLNPKVEANGLVDVALLGLSKAATERFLIPVIGNSTPMSGAIKLIGGSAAHSFGGKVGKIVGGGMVIDGIEDLTISLMGGLFGGSSGGAQAGPSGGW